MRNYFYIIMKKLIIKIIGLIDILLVIPVIFSGWIFKNVRRIGFQRLPLCKKFILAIGVFPIRNHYYEPQFDFRSLKRSFSQERNLPGINLEIEEQLKFLKNFRFGTELLDVPKEKGIGLEYYLNNNSFEEGDSEYWYQLIRYIKPRRVIEIGSGYSTLMARKAINKNHHDDKQYVCDHICIEPYEMPWLEEIDISVIREKVENVDLSFFSSLKDGDILFIDSSHVIRPEGDVIFEYLEILPNLNKGVIVHVHDIFLQEIILIDC